MGPKQYDIILLRKSKRLDNWDHFDIWETFLGFGGIRSELICIIVEWLCPHTAKIHLYANFSTFDNVYFKFEI